jgi:arylsulfatase A-like enzyme
MRGTLASMVSAALLLPLLGTTASAAAGSPKHILFLMIDDLGYNDVSYRNTSDLSSPNIDALALGGIRLERYYTHNLCSPSRTSFLSGRYASTLGMDGCVIVNGHAIDLPAEVDTVADRLGKGGFKSAAFGKCTSRPSSSRFTDRCRRCG